MKTEKMLLQKNWKEQAEASKLGLESPDPIFKKSRFLFYLEDVKTAFIDQDGLIVLNMYDDSTYPIEYEKSIWDSIEKFFEDSEKEKKAERKLLLPD